MNYNNNFRMILISFAFLLLCNSCTKEGNKIDFIYGEWKVEDLRSTSTNGERGTVIGKEYYIEFDTENC